jgi:hypothetical protein
MDVREAKTFWVLMSLLALGGALFACFLAFFVFSFQGDTGDGDRLAEGVLLALALAGLVPVFGMLIQSIDGKGHPARWLAGAVCIYAVWYLAIYGV